MRSKFKDLHCPCGCELSAHATIDKLYNDLKNYYGKAVVIESLVDCSTGTNNEILVKVNQHEDRTYKELLILSTGNNFQAVFSRESKRWLLAARKPYGVYYESAPALEEHSNI